MKELHTPIGEEEINQLSVGDMVYISGDIFAGRDAVLPQLVKAFENGDNLTNQINLEGGVVFHTAVSQAGVGPTSSNKLEIEGSIVPLSHYGIRIHLGKGKISAKTIQKIKKEGAVFAVIPPVTALLESKILNKKIVAFPEEGMEALHLLSVDKFPAIIAAAKGKSIYD